MDLSTTYLGLRLRNPLLASASPLSGTVDGVRGLADAGVGAVVLYSLFEEQLRRAAERDGQLVAQGGDSNAESLSYFPPSVDLSVDLGRSGHRYLRLVERAAAAVVIPVIGSLNASTPGAWARYARSIQDAGAAAGHLDLAYACVDTLVFTTADPATAAPWLAPAMLDRVASTLNYFMKALAGAQKGVELDGKGVGLGGHGRKGVEMGGIGEGSGGRTQVGGARGQPPTRPPSDRSPRPV